MPGTSPEQSTVSTPGPALPTALPESTSIGTVELPVAAPGEPVAIEPGVVVEVSNVAAADVSAVGPGDVSGPGIRVQLSVGNGSAAAVDLSGFVVTTSYGDLPASPVEGSGAAPFSGTLPTGGTATATYLFTNPSDTSGPVTIRVEYNRSENVLIVKP